MTRTIERRIENTKNQNGEEKIVKMQGTKKLEDGIIYEVHFEADYEQQQKKFNVFVNGEQIDRFHETKKIFWYKALAKAPAATVVRKFENEQDFENYVNQVKEWMVNSGYTIIEK